MRYRYESWPLVTVTIAILFSIAGFSAFAQERPKTEKGERIWDLTLGAGVSFEPEYDGKDKYLKFLPIVKGKLHFGIFNLFAGTSGGAGIGAEFDGSIPISLSIGAKLGEGRTSSDASAFEGLPDVENAYRLFCAAELDLRLLGTLGIEMTYLPTSVDYQAGSTNYDAILIAASLGKKIPIGRGIRLEAEIGVDWMNADYAEANYGVREATADMHRYYPGKGIRSVSGSVGAACMFSKHLGASLNGSIDYLVGDAADSPIVAEPFQPTVKAYAFYKF